LGFSVEQRVASGGHLGSSVSHVHVSYCDERMVQ
jgi:hypothetical protein